MKWRVRYAVMSYLRSAIWTAPVFALALEQVTFRVASAHSVDFGWIPGFVFDRDGTIALADYNITSSIAFIVFTFSSMIVAIQLASGQLSPRIIATMLLRDKAIRRSVSLFVYVLLLAVAIKARVNTIPRSLISITAILGLVSVIVFMFLIDYAARLLRPVNIVWRLARSGLDVVDSVYPDPFTNESLPERTLARLGRAERTIRHDGNSAVVIAVNQAAVVREARRADAMVELVPHVGDFVASGDPLFRVHGANATAADEDLLRGQVAFGRERTIEQDSTFAFRVITDIALKALSPAINDPTTAVIAIDQLHTLLRTVGNRNLHSDWIHDEQGQLRMCFRTPKWNDFVYLACCEIRQYGASSVQVSRRLRAMIENTLENLPESRRPALRQQLELLDRTIQSAYRLPEDVALARVPDSQGLGGGLDSPAANGARMDRHCA
jgi:uncharacterized membrane protein